MTGEFRDIGAMLMALKPDEPVYALRLHELRRAAQTFVIRFPGDVLYAVGANSCPAFLPALHAGGIRHFAVANIEELRAVRTHFPAAPCYFLNPVKSATAIREAAHNFGVTHFATDHPDELAKIIVHTTPLKPTIAVRLAVPQLPAGRPADDKSGCGIAEAASLMRAIAAEGLGMGLGFHLGAQVRDPQAYRRALDFAGDVVRAAGVQPEWINVGGGFPVMNATRMPPLVDYTDAIREGLAHMPLHRPARLACQPGRALASTGASLIVRVELRRGNRLYLNDGIHGGLGALSGRNATLPLRAWRINGAAQVLPPVSDGFAFYGPTGDSADKVAGPFALPADIHTGDYIEIGQMGAYSANRRSGFGGFLSARHVIVNDPLFQV